MHFACFRVFRAFVCQMPYGQDVLVCSATPPPSFVCLLAGMSFGSKFYAPPPPLARPCIRLFVVVRRTETERNLCGNCFFKRFAFIFSTQVK